MITEELQQIAADELTQQNQCKHRLFVCMGTTCLSAHSDAVKASLEAEIESHGHKDAYRVLGGGGKGLRAAGPLVPVEPAGTIYRRVKPEDPAEVVKKRGPPIPRLQDPATDAFFQR